MRAIAYERLAPEKGIPHGLDHLRRLWKAGKFPKPIQLFGRKLVWDEEEIDAFPQGEICSCSRSANGTGY
jgi:Prophage CP4-57 regulatory protein (AlpA)